MVGRRSHAKINWNGPESLKIWGTSHPCILNIFFMLNVNAVYKNLLLKLPILTLSLFQIYCRQLLWLPTNYQSRGTQLWNAKGLVYVQPKLCRLRCTYEIWKYEMNKNTTYTMRVSLSRIQSICIKLKHRVIKMSQFRMFQKIVIIHTFWLSPWDLWPLGCSPKTPFGVRTASSVHPLHVSFSITC